MNSASNSAAAAGSGLAVRSSSSMHSVNDFMKVLKWSSNNANLSNCSLGMDAPQLVHAPSSHRSNSMSPNLHSVHANTR